MRHAVVSWTRRLTLAAAAASALLSLASVAHAAKTELLVYSALEADQIKAYKTAFEKSH
ncbi:MAG: putative 2-aminoethylphosphonate ABC transporter substrate-binding protein, partial [Comamonas sp.]|nr:putative 2-aminoethylphosphonate ABC transporter substrate-binding protein [Comamonas sp.]